MGTHSVRDDFQNDPNVNNPSVHLPVGLCVGLQQWESTAQSLDFPPQVATTAFLPISLHGCGWFVASGLSWRMNLKGYWICAGEFVVMRYSGDHCVLLSFHC